MQTAYSTHLDFVVIGVPLMTRETSRIANKGLVVPLIFF